MGRKLTRSEWLAKFESVHGDRYDYSRVSNDVGSDSIVEIVCVEHGVFKQGSSSHYHRGCGCPVCAGSVVTRAERLDKFRQVHGDVYDYSMLPKRLTTTTPIKIICKCHGVFQQSVAAHRQGHGCPKCGFDNMSQSHIKDGSEWLVNFRKVHGDRYSYERSVFINGNTPIIIGCKRHGDFRQLPFSHYIQKSGCPKCNSSRGEAMVRRILESIGGDFTEQQTFDDCVYKRKLSFDFYVGGILIEYQGKQHREPIELFGGVDKFKIQQLTDTIKRDYCEANNIPLLEVWFDDKDPEQTIKDFLNNN